MSAAAKNTTPPSGYSSAAPQQYPFGRIETVTAPETVQSIWNTLAQNSCATAYQDYAFNQAWYKNLSEQENAHPLVIVAFDHAGEPCLLLALAICRRGPLHIAMYAGGRHANLNMPLIRPGLNVSAADMLHLLKKAARESQPAIDLYALRNQPVLWAGTSNPVAELPNSPSPSNAYGAYTGDNGEAYLQKWQSKAARKKLRSKARKLAEYGTIAVERAQNTETAQKILAVFCRQKSDHFTSKNKDAGLNDNATRQFLESLAAFSGDKPPVLDLYALYAGDTIAATFGGLRHGTHWHGLFNSYESRSDLAQFSPGQILLQEIIRDLSERGITDFDLGVGEARYKNAFCNQTITLADVLIPISVAGYCLRPLAATGQYLKRSIKKSPWALAFAERIRSRTGI